MVDIQADLLIKWREFLYCFQGCSLTRIESRLRTIQDGLSEHVRFYPSCRVIADDGRVFTLAVDSPRVTGSSKGQIILWDHTGGIWLSAVEAEVLDSKTIAELERVMDNWRKGLVACADCGEVVPINYNRRYFAGVYCEGCWIGTQGRHVGKGGWRAIEKRETYN